LYISQNTQQFFSYVILRILLCIMCIHFTFCQVGSKFLIHFGQNLSFSISLNN
jgi:hypothetical protein